MSQQDFEVCEAPNGGKVYYRDRDHSYWGEIRPKKQTDPDGPWRGGKRLTGVTSVVNPYGFDGTGALMGWAVKKTLGGVVELVSAELSQDVRKPNFSWLADLDDLKSRLRAEGVTADDVRDAAADVGTDIHEYAFRALAEGKATPEYSKMSRESIPYAQAVASFWLDYQPKILQSEQIVFCKTLEVAGRFDLRAMINGKVVMLDLKTGNYVHTTAHVQVAGYDYLARKNGFGPSDEQVILHVDDEGGYTLVPVQAQAADFVKACTVYERAKAIDKGAKAAVKEGWDL